MKPSIILVREWQQQMSSSGCCGRLEGDLLKLGKKRVFPRRRQIMEDMGPLYRTIRKHYEDAVDLLVIDPRNQVVLLSRLVRDFFRYRVGFRQALRTLRGLSIMTVIVNGRLFAREAWPDPEALLAHVDDVMHEEDTRHVTFRS